MKLKKVIDTIRLNRKVDAWYKSEAAKQEMNKSELMRKILVAYYDSKIN